MIDLLKIPRLVVSKSFEAINVIFSPLTRIIEKIVASILKTCVFQEASFQSRFSKAILMPATRKILNIWQRYQGIPKLREAFDPKRLEKSRNFLKLFGEEKNVFTEDGKKTTYVLYRSDKFFEWIRKNGGILKKQANDTIIQAKDDISWQNLKRLQEFRCFEVDEQKRFIRIPTFLRGAREKCIFRCQGFGRQIPMDKRYIGLHLALGFNYAVFDWREKEVSLPKYCKDAEAVYEEVKKSFRSNKIIAMGSCRASFVVSHLKAKYHQEGMETVLVHPVPSLSSTIDTKSWLIRKIGLIGLRGLQKGGEDFDNLKRLKSITSKNSARTIIITSQGDKTLPSNTKDLFKKATQDKSPTIVWDIPHKKGFDPHFADPLLLRENLLYYARLLVSA